MSYHIGIFMMAIRRYLLWILLLVTFSTRTQARIDQNECDQYLTRSDCYFYPCLDRSFRCGPFNHLVGFSYDFCQLTTEYFRPEWSSDEAKFFLNVQNCSMDFVKKKFVQPTISELFRCADLQEKLIEIHFICLTKDKAMNFCSMLCENLRTFLHLFVRLDYQQTNLLGLLRRIFGQCGKTTNESTIPRMFFSMCNQTEENLAYWNTIVSRLKNQFKKFREVFSLHV